ncbi:MAG TPA: hypothetical protein VHV82_01700 [Sporichthyaceae bacterium]|nr:hypothetical protein [Sporichthyaceae bacterium]
MTIGALDTAGLRRTVLEVWAAAPARFREDANAEEELVLGAYRDRLVVELAQNAADAAARAGSPGRLLLELTAGAAGPTLVASNTGAALDRAGVESLSTLRASTKRDEAGVGRFGVGFAAVLAVTDEPQVWSTGGSVAWSAERTRSAVAEFPAVAAEVARRGGAVPVLRLPFDVVAEPAPGWDTAVVLPLRDPAAAALVERLLAEIDDALLLALPGLASVEIAVGGGRRLLTARRDGPWVDVEDGSTRTRWQVSTRAGELEPRLLADRPVEEHGRARWQVTWAVPTADGSPVDLPVTSRAVVHAPTPTDDPLDLPALLIGSFPVDSSRRRVAPGPLTDFLVEAAADAYADLVVEVAAVAGPVTLRLVPGPMGVGEVDARVRRAILDRLTGTGFLPAADGGPRLRPRDASVIPGAGPRLVEVLAPVLDGLVAPGWALPAVTRLGARTSSLAELVDELVGCDREPAWWRGLYDALEGVDREALRGLPVPLTDGRLVRDPRDVLLPGAVAVETLAALGLRVAHPDAVHPLLERLGARPAQPATVLDHPAVRGRVRGLAGAEPDEQFAVAEAVLALVAAAPPASLDWLADLLLPDEAGEPTPSGELLLPGGALVEVLEPGALGVVDPAWVQRFGADTLRAVGVLDSFAVVRDSDVPADPDAADHDLDGEPEWLAVVAEQARVGVGSRFDAPEIVTEFVAVRDLDLVAPDRWPQALRLLAGPALRGAITDPARVRRADGRGIDVIGYPAWWLRNHPVLDGRRPRDLRLPGGDELLAGLWDEAVGGLDPQFARALGVRAVLAEVLADDDGPSDLLTRLADPGRTVGRRQLAAIYRAVAAVAPDGVPEQDWIRVPDRWGTRVVRAADVVIVDAPDLLAVQDGVALPMPPEVAPDLADVLLLPLASVRTPAPVVSLGRPVAVPDPVRQILAAAPAEYFEHDTLLVAGPAGDVEVDWRWVDGRLHAATTRGLSYGLAWAAGEWARRWLVCEAVEEPERLAEVLDEDDFAASFG